MYIVLYGSDWPFFFIAVLIPDGVALRGLFVIDPNQVVRVAHIHDLPIGRSVDETLRVIEAIKFTDEHGEVNLSFSG